LNGVPYLQTPQEPLCSQLGGIWPVILMTLNVLFLGFVEG
jgi:hypothetical protein